METVNILGVPIAAVNMDQAVDIIENCVRDGRSEYVNVVNVHSIMEAYYNKDFKSIHKNALMCTPDGMPLVWIGRSAGHKNMTRVYGPGLMLKVLERSVEKGWSHFFYGGKPGVAELLRDKLVERFKGLKVAGVFSPSFKAMDEKEESELTDMFNELSPDITWVSLGCPKQEKWMAGHVGKLNTRVMIGVGAAFDFHTGLVKEAPKWMRSAGLEWFFRLCCEPRRLWKRYLVYNSLFIWNYTLQRLGIKKPC